jgi:hypothetical protein
MHWVLHFRKLVVRHGMPLFFAMVIHER